MDIVWFAPDKSEHAMRALVVPWPETEWRIRRGKMHPFRSWRAVNAPNTDGSPRKGLMQCVCVDYQGSVRLAPGAIKDKKLTIAEHLYDIQEIDTGLIGAKILSSVWSRPEFVESAGKQEAREQRAKASVEQFTKHEQIKALTLRKGAIRRYLLAMAHSRRITWRTPDTVLQDIVLMDQIEEDRQETIGLEDWLNVIAPLPAVAEQGEYDPVSFLAHAAALFAKVGRTEYEVGKVA
jgi:hypothetical protein